ncbi:MAG: hypothetical protein JW927_17915 [Deltaproteobacteria bacterium]|nr:hypothetical protein [Deltaproteobacteria bacterium]
MVIRMFCIVMLLFPCYGFAQETYKTIGVFVALADNEHQGIVKVPDAIGKGDDPDKNLYWGTADGLKGFFGRSKDWKLTQTTNTNSSILRTIIYRHTRHQVVLNAFAYKGEAISKCIQAFEMAISSGTYDMVVYIGHNGLMDFTIPMPNKTRVQGKAPDCVVLCCKSEQHFRERIISAGGRPILLTSQFMYPGAFILHAIVDDWILNKPLGTIRSSAGAAYAKKTRIFQRGRVLEFLQKSKKVMIKAKEKTEPDTSYQLEINVGLLRLTQPTVFI